MISTSVKALDTRATLLFAVHTRLKVSDRLFFPSTFFPDWNILKHVLNFEKMSSLVKTSKGMDSMLEVKYILHTLLGQEWSAKTTERRSSSQIHEIDWFSLLCWKRKPWDTELKVFLWFLAAECLDEQVKKPSFSLQQAKIRRYKRQKNLTENYVQAKASERLTNSGWVLLKSNNYQF